MANTGLGNNVPSSVGVPGGAPANPLGVVMFLTQFAQAVNNWVRLAANAINALNSVVAHLVASSGITSILGGTGISVTTVGTVATVSSTVSGTVTSISAGTGITCSPNPITGSGTIALALPIPNSSLQNSSITLGGLPVSLGGSLKLSVFNVQNYGATGNGVTDDTAAVNSALSAASANGGGTVYFPSTGFAYLIGTGLTIPNNVNLLGDSGFEWSGANFVFPSTNWTKGGSWIQFTDTVNPGLTVQNGSRIERLNFGYAQPVPSSTPGTAWTPTTFPYTIKITGNFNGLRDITILNASHGVDWEYTSGSGGGTYCWMEDCFITGFYVCMRVKNANDTMSFRNIHHRNLWYVSNSNIVDWQEGSGGRAGQTGWDIQYIDNPIIDGVEFFQQNIAINLTDSTVNAGGFNITHAMALGQFNNVSFNLCVQAMNCTSGATTATFFMNNVIVQSDTTTNRAASFFFNLASNNVVGLMSNVYVPFVGNGLMSIGGGSSGGKVEIDQIRVDSYGTFAASSCFTINTGAVLDLPCGHGNIVTQGGAGGKFAGAGAIQNVTLQSQLIALGTSTNNNAATGFVGEFISSNIAQGSAISLTTSTVANVTSISLTAGDWDVTGAVACLPGTGATMTSALVGISNASASITVGNLSQGSAEWIGSAAAGSGVIQTIMHTRYSLSATTTIFLCADATFSGGACTAWGYIQARRAR